MPPGPSPKVAWTVHALVALAGVVPTLLSPGHVTGSGVDAFGSVWFFWWIRTCLAHFGNPSHTDLFFFPDGKDIFADTGNNFVDAVLAAPLAWVFGPSLYQPLWVVIVQLANAGAFRALARELWGDERTVFVAALLWQVNPFLLFEVTGGRPTQAFAWAVPVAVYYFLRTARGGGWRDVLGLGASVAVAGWIYWYSAFFLVFLLLPLAAFELRGRPWRPVLGRWALAAGVGLLLVLPAVLPMAEALREGRVPGSGPPEPLGRPLQNNVAVELHGLVHMETQGEPLFTHPAWGLPLLAALFWPRLVVPGGRARWVAALVVTGVLGLGLGFPVGDRVVGNPVYALLYEHLPFFKRLWFPYRFAQVAFVPALVLIVAWWRATGARTAVVALLVAGLAVQVHRDTWPFPHLDARCPEPLARLQGPGAVIITPIGIQHDGLIWQTTFARPTFGGMGESAPVFWPDAYKKRLRTGFIRALSDASQGQARPYKPQEREAIERLGFGFVALRLDFVAERATRNRKDPEAAKARARELTTLAVGAPPVAEDERVAVWSLRGP